MKSVDYKMIFIAGVILLFTLNGRSQTLQFYGEPEIFLPGIVSTKNSEVKITFNRQGNKILWGGIDWIAGKKDLDIWQSELRNGK